MAWIIAKKLEMTRVIKEDKFIPITLLKIPVLKVVAVKTIEKDWYEAVVVGVLKEDQEVALAEGKVALNVSLFEEVKEFDIKDGQTFNIGDTITLDILEGISEVRVEGISKWKGFAGAMKKWNFSGGPKTHGSKFHRALGSIWNRKPRRTHKGKKMHGHMGCEKVSIKKVPLELINKEISVIGVRGGVPGGRNASVSIIF